MKRMTCFAMKAGNVRTFQAAIACGVIYCDTTASRAALSPVNVPDHYTAADFIYDHDRGVYVLAFGGHVATVRDGQIWDSWDSSHEVPVYYYKRG